MSTIKATIIEQGNRLPGVGDLVYDSDNNTVYKITETVGETKRSAMRIVENHPEVLKAVL